MIFSSSARESNMLPPAKLLRQNFTGLASYFRLRSAFDVISSDPLSSDVSLPLSAWNFARVSFSSIHSANTVGERSNYLTLALHLLSVDGSSRPFQSTRFRYSRIRKKLGGAVESLHIGYMQSNSLHTIQRCRQPELWWQILVCFWENPYGCPW